MAGEGQILTLVGRPAVALSLPQLLAQRFHESVLREMPIAVTRLQLALQIANSRRTIDGDLLADRKMQPHMQEGVVRGKRGILFISDRGVRVGYDAFVLWARGDHVRNLRLERRQW